MEMASTNSEPEIEEDARKDVEPSLERSETSDGHAGDSEEDDVRKEEDTTVEEDLDLDHCARTFAEFLHVDTSSHTADLEENIEDMLRHIEEFCGQLGTIQMDTAFALQQKIPEIHSKAVQMKEMYKKIDDLESFILTVRRNVNEMEECVSTAEKHFGSNAVSRALKTFQLPGFVSRGRAARSGSKPEVVRWDCPQIFRTDDFFGSSPPPVQDKATAS